MRVDSPEPYDGAVNVASGEPHTILDMATAIADTIAEGALRPEVVGGYRLGDVRHVFASPRLAEERIGFRAGIGFEDGMREFARAPLPRRGIRLIDIPRICFESCKEREALLAGRGR